MKNYHLLGEPEIVFQDRSVIIPDRSGLPKVYAPSVSFEQIRSEARIKYMRERRAKAKEMVSLWQGLERPTAVVVNPATYGGPDDDGVTSKEPAVILGILAKEIEVKKPYIVWFLPEQSEENPNSPIKVPSVETWLGGEGSLKDKIGEANKKLKDFFVEVTSLDESGRVIAGPILAIPADRGPSTIFENPRIDLTIGLARDLKIEESLRNPNSPECQVTLVLRLVPKPKNFYGPDSDPAQFSRSGGEKFELPSWRNEDTVAANP